mmetsp:Transcript_62300/g.146888  ORF Transcript_62300/g.146888 Transcript_62300/m.146888 type:complete len:211 (-) Transcript_62300:748-1380(-)
MSRRRSSRASFGFFPESWAAEERVLLRGEPRTLHSRGSEEGEEGTAEGGAAKEAEAEEGAEARECDAWAAKRRVALGGVPSRRGAAGEEAPGECTERCAREEARGERRLLFPPPPPPCTFWRVSRASCSHGAWTSTRWRTAAMARACASCPGVPSHLSSRRSATDRFWLVSCPLSWSTRALLFSPSPPPNLNCCAACSNPLTSLSLCFDT